MTTYEALCARVRDLCHDATSRGEAFPLIVAALEITREYEIAIAQNLALEATVRRLTKGEP